ncbi:MAG TPA: hypothetical protein VGR52_01485 [Stellaceae bacterium]|nr:hypothetical protein [Stellaceae bacterium]
MRAVKQPAIAEVPRLPRKCEHPDLTVQQARKWFRECAPNWPTPEQQQLARFTREINQLKKLKNKPHDRAQLELKKAAARKLESARRALRDLSKYLPDLIPEFFPCDDAVRDLLAAARAARDTVGDPRGPGQPEKQWPSGASEIAFRAIRAWESAGMSGSGISHQTPEGPVAKIVQKALVFIEGTAPDLATIAKHFQRKPPYSRRKN